MSRVALGCDPGSVDAGIVVRRGSEVLAHRTVHRAADEDGPRGIGVGPAHLTAVVNAMRELEAEFDPDLIGVEGLRPPNPHQRRRDGNSVINPRYLLGAAAGYGAVLVAFPKATIVPPGKNGSAFLGTYPLELVGPRERNSPGWQLRVGTGKLRHVRSAWDIAGHTYMQARLYAAQQA